MSTHGLKVEPLTELDTGAIVLAASESVKGDMEYEHCVVLTYWPGNFQPYVVHYCGTEEPMEGKCSSGGYYHRISDAVADFQERVERLEYHHGGLLQTGDRVVVIFTG